MAKVYSTDEINRLITGREAVLGEVYNTDSGETYVGIKDGLLRLKGNADNTTFTPTPELSSTNTQAAIQQLEENTQTTTTDLQVQINNLSTNVASASNDVVAYSIALGGL